MRFNTLKRNFTRIEDDDLHKHFSIINERIYHNDTRKDVTQQSYVTIHGHRYNTRKVAFFLIHERWPSAAFLLPWE